MTSPRFVSVFLLGTALGLNVGCSESSAGPDASDSGAISVTLQMTGNVPDPNGFQVSLDGGSARPLLPGGSVRFAGLEAGSHVVWLTDIAAYCALDGENPRIVSVRDRDTVTTHFAVACSSGGAAHIALSKIAVAMVPGGSETLEVQAVDAAGDAVSWTAASGDAAVATVATAGPTIAVTGVGYGTTAVTVSSTSGVVRTIPVRVYDPMVLDAGELTLRYVSAFNCRWHDAGSGGTYDGSFYHPVVTDGFKPLGSLALRAYGCPNVNGRQWMIAVKADSGSTALAAPLRYIREYDDAGSGANIDGSFWTPVCPAGYAAMGTVAQRGWSSPGLNDVACVREDLARPGEAAPDFTWIDAETGASDYLGTWRTTISDMSFHDKTWLETGTFVGTGSEHSCSGSACWQRPYSHPAMNVLAVDLPLLTETPSESWIPWLTGYEQPPMTTAPLMAKTVLVPFTALVGGADFSQGDIQWLLANSPFVRVERQVYHKLMFHTINNTSVVQENALELVTGVSTTNSETFSHTVGISITVESGVSFLGSGGKVSATMSYEFGYESMHSVTALQERHIVVTIYTPPQRAAACWQQRNTYVVKRHNGTRLDVLAEMEFGMDTYVVDEFPD